MEHILPYTLFCGTVAIDLIKLPEARQTIKWEMLRMSNYLIWVLVSFYALVNGGTNVVIYRAMTLVVQSITLNYVYEIVYHRPDEAHTIHHSISLALQVLWVYMYNIDTPFLRVVTVVGHLNNAAMVSSIFSSLRHILRSVTSRSRYEACTQFYKWMYVVSKVCSGLCQYKVLLDACFTENEPLGMVFVVCLATLLTLHSIQAYFVSKIVC